MSSFGADLEQQMGRKTRKSRSQGRMNVVLPRLPLFLVFHPTRCYQSIIIDIFETAIQMEFETWQLLPSISIH
jgi:hypothetical protein